MNCNSPTNGKYNYQGVVLCSHCHSLALMCDKRAVQQVQQLLTVYRESLRVALASGKLRPSTKIRQGGKATMPTKDDLIKILDKLADVRRSK